MSEERYIEHLDPEMAEPIIKIEGTIFEILIKAHGLTHVKDNIYKSESGRKYHLTKFGLEPAVVFSAREETLKIQHELERVSGQLVEARRKIDKLEAKPDNAEIVQLHTKIDNQREGLRGLHNTVETQRKYIASLKKHIQQDVSSTVEE